jgi:hypothetical protein
MKAILLLVTLVLLLGNTLSAQTPTHTLSAIKDFEKKNDGEVPLYIDKQRNAVAINAANESYRGKWAKATTVFKGKSGKYDVTITTLTEEDGECTYKIFVNDLEVGNYQNPRVKKVGDSQPNKHLWKDIDIKSGDKLSIESNTHSNGIIPENGAFAWARGRWRQIELVLLKSK